MQRENGGCGGLLECYKRISKWGKMVMVACMHVSHEWPMHVIRVAYKIKVFKVIQRNTLFRCA